MELSPLDIPLQSLLACVYKEREILQMVRQWVNFSLEVLAEVVNRFELQREVKLILTSHQHHNIVALDTGPVERSVLRSRI